MSKGKKNRALTRRERHIAEKVYGAYRYFMGDDITQINRSLAVELSRLLGGEAVFGYLKWNGQLREHYWVNRENIIIDPILERFKEQSITRYRHKDYKHIEIRRGIM